MHDEENISAQQPPQEEDSRLPGPDADTGRPACAQGPPGQGAQASQRLRSSGDPEPGRVRRSAEYRRIYREGTRVASRWFVMFAARGGKETRYGITASRKVGNAVVRNRCKRRLRVLARRYLRGLGLDVVLNARRGLDGAPWSELEREFERCVRVLRSRRGSRTER